MVALTALVGSIGFDLKPIPDQAKSTPQPKAPKRSRHEVVQEFVYSGVHQNSASPVATWRCPRCRFERDFGTLQGAVTRATEHVIRRHPEVGA